MAAEGQGWELDGCWRAGLGVGWLLKGRTGSWMAAEGQDWELDGC